MKVLTFTLKALTDAESSDIDAQSSDIDAQSCDIDAKSSTIDVESAAGVKVVGLFVAHLHKAIDFSYIRNMTHAAQ